MPIFYAPAKTATVQFKVGDTWVDLPNANWEIKIDDYTARPGEYFLASDYNALLAHVWSASAVNGEFVYEQYAPDYTLDGDMVPV